MNDLSAKQQQILEYMKAEVREKGYPPSVREICEAVGLKSTSTVHGHLARLEGSYQTTRYRNSGRSAPQS